MMPINVSEYFYSIQGEGKTAGYPAIFLRLGGCNLLCGGEGTDKDKRLHGNASWRCDTVEVWQKSKKYTSESLFNEMDERIGLLRLLDEGVRIIVTGGEPLLQQRAIVAFLEYIQKEHAIIPAVEIETNCTILPVLELRLKVDQWNVSPKLISSGADMKKAVQPEIFHWFALQRKTVFKFVVFDDRDITTINALVSLANVPKSKVWLMPAAGTRDELLIANKRVAEYCKEYYYQFTSRLQLEIWDKAVGV